MFNLLMLAQFRSNSTLTKKIYDHTMNPLCGLYHITRMELDIMLFLANNPDYDTATDIIEQKRFTKSHVSSSLKTLEEKGYLERAFRSGNRKTVHLKLLPASESIVAAGQKAQNQVFEKIFAGFSPQEIAALEKISAKISMNIQNSLKEV